MIYCPGCLYRRICHAVYWRFFTSQSVAITASIGDDIHDASGQTTWINNMRGWGGWWEDGGKCWWWGWGWVRGGNQFGLSLTYCKFIKSKGRSLQMPTDPTWKSREGGLRGVGE
jgi:hypothetical protein